MLILTRRVGETLMVGDEVTVTVLGVKVTKFVSVWMRQKKSLYTVKKFTNVSKKRKKTKKIQVFDIFWFFALQFLNKWVIYAPCYGEVAEWPKALPC